MPRFRYLGNKVANNVAGRTWLPNEEADVLDDYVEMLRQWPDTWYEMYQADVGSPSKVTNLRVCATDTGLLVYWDQPKTGPADSYVVTLSPGGGGTTTTGTSAEFTGLFNGVAYTVTVVPVRGARRGASSSASATPTLGPTSAKGLALWYDASQESYSNGANVTSLTDRSGNGFNSLQVSAAPPVFVSSWTNGKSAMTFTSGTPKFLKTGIKISDVPGPVTIFWVGQFDSVSGNKRLLNWRSVAALGVRQGFMLDHNGTSMRCYSVEPNNQVHTVANTTPYIVSVVVGGGFLYLNGAKTATVNVTSVQPVNPKVDQYLYVNSDYGTALHADQKMAELLVYNRALNQAERWAVEAALASKYNITVSQA